MRFSIRNLFLIDPLPKDISIPPDYDLDGDNIIISLENNKAVVHKNITTISPALQKTKITEGRLTYVSIGADGKSIKLPSSQLLKGK